MAMTFKTFGLRFLSVTSLAVWFGGFSFYGAAVIPALHDELSGPQAGAITRRVTDLLNLVGIVTLAIWWGTAWLERSILSRRFRRTRLVLLSTTSPLLAFLIILHRIMDHHLDAYGLRGFYPLHRVYLIASTVQWIVNLGLFAVTVIDWRYDFGESGESIRRTRGSA